MKRLLSAHYSDWSAAWRAVAAEEFPIWLQALRTLIAMLLALAVAFRLDLSSPSSAAVTVAVVSLPQSGMVLEKSFYRLLATGVGALVTLILIAIFAQQRDLFIVMVALWIGACAALSARFRNFQSYGWALAGYTACLIGFPAYMNAEHAFDIVVDRVSIVGLGVICGGLVNAVLFPRTSSVSLVQIVRRSFRDFAAFVQTTLQGYASPRELHTTQRQFLQDIVALESARASSYFEDPDSRIRTPRLRRFISQFMTASTTAHAINRLRENLIARNFHSVIAALQPLHTLFLRALQTEHKQAPTMAAQAVVVVDQLAALLANWTAEAAAARARLPADVASAAVLELESALVILREFVEEAFAFAETYAELRTSRSALDMLDSAAPVARADRITATIAGLRTACTLMVVSAFWIASGWPDGFPAALLSTVACTLFVNAPAPTQAVWQMAKGFVLGFVAGVFCFTFVLPALDGMVLLAAGLAPFLLVGTYLMARPSTASIGSGYCMMFLVSQSITANMQYDVVGLLNGGLAQIVGVLVAAIAFSVLFPTNTRWHARRIEKTLWRELYIARHTLPATARHRFESGVRDLSLQWLNLAANDAQRQQRLLASMTLLETGRAMLTLRDALTQADAGRYAIRVSALLDDTLEIFTGASTLTKLPLLERAIAALADDIESSQRTTPSASLLTLRTALQLLQLAVVERRTLADENHMRVANEEVSHVARA